MSVASFVGATTVRMHVLGEDDIDPTPEQLATMQELVREAMREGALGVGHYADVVVFDSATVTDHSTYVDPRRH